MAPRNNDENASYKKKNFPVEDNEVDVKNVVPCLLHKKHKVVKLIKSQIQKINEEGFICSGAGSDTEVYFSEEEGRTRRATKDEGKAGTSRNNRSSSLTEGEADASPETRGGPCMCIYLLGFLISIFLLLLLMVWISAGPLSNTMAHTPVSPISFVQTDNLCTLEKKYLLRWSKPEYFE